MQAQSPGDDLAPALGGLNAAGEVEVGAPQGQGAGVAQDGAFIDVEDAGAAGVGGGVADLLSGTALRAEAVQRELPGDVIGEVLGGAAWAEDKVLVGGALGDEGPDLFLWGICQWVTTWLRVKDMVVGVAYLGEDFFFLKLAQLRHCALEVEASLVRNVGHVGWLIPAVLLWSKLGCNGGGGDGDGIVNRC